VFLPKVSKHSLNRRCFASRTPQLQSPSAAVSQEADQEQPSSATPRQPPIAVPPREGVESQLNDILGVYTRRVSNNRRQQLGARTQDSPARRTFGERLDPTAPSLREDRPRNTIEQRQGAIARDMGFDVESTQDIMGGIQTGALSRLRLPPLPPPVRLDAFVGRSEEVDPLKGVDLSVALRRLNIKLAYNNVKGDFFRQRFHERPGLKRKRLKSERWRRKFKEGFQAMCKKVQNMRRKGW
jgi:small subunit ribosomal protein MRP21